MTQNNFNQQELDEVLDTSRQVMYQKSVSMESGGDKSFTTRSQV